MPQIKESSPWWLESPPNLNAAPIGLSSDEASARLAQFGTNTLKGNQDKSLFIQFLAKFKNPLVLILLVASAISALTGEITNFVIISMMVLLSVILDFVQEYRANSAAEKLKASVALKATVIRDGQPTEIPSAQIVPGDLILLSAGDLIPADGFVLEAKDFFVKQSLLTGEPYPIEKHAGVLTKASNDIQDATNAVFMGTSVISGMAKLLVVKTGLNTSLGAISDRISMPAKPSSFETGTRRFGMLIMRLTVFMVMFVLLVNTYFHKPWLESFLFAVALAVGLTPELLPMIISVTLSRGAMRLSKKDMIVKRLAAIQDLGSMDVLCTDKTGTLTEAKISLEQHIDAKGKSSDRVFELAYLNSHFETGLKSPLDMAIVEHKTIDISTWQKVDEVPFDFERRRVSILLANQEEALLVVKGSPDEILELCGYYYDEDLRQHFPIEATRLAAIKTQQHALEENGFRVLAIACRHLPLAHQHASLKDEAELIFAGYVAFIDPPKTSAAVALESLKQLGVSIKIVTGDSDLVTRHICQELNIPVTGLLTGKDIAQLDDASLQVKAEQCNLFCRVNPTQKERVINALKTRGHVVGYLGDGINDAPSLHAADIGLSVDSAVDVAKEAADIILLKQDLSVLNDGVMEGRRTFGNIMKYIMMGTSSNFGNMFSMAGAALFIPFLPMLPTQILLNNILYDLSEVAIPLDNVDQEDLKLPRILDMNFIRNFMFVIGSISSLFDFLTFYVMLEVLHAHEKLFQTGWFVESLCTQIMVIFIIRTKGNPFKSNMHPLLKATSISIVLVAILIPFTKIGADFGFVPPTLEFYYILGGMVVAYLLIVEMAKRLFYRWIQKRMTNH